ncbi:hypothetical protein Patl1_34905 [Pistacia atlantica]|uniref:Uncharacterized protein n=1 Tax=Pistacia atlantica TaxID=434234 RepID=A0ACC0ZU82_9ROSI|nr:hypothetical protein Patl1_34905 [Pistacia atlantica]
MFRKIGVFSFVISNKDCGSLAAIFIKRGDATTAFYQVTVLLVLNFRGTSILQLKSKTREHANDVRNTMIFNTLDSPPLKLQIFNEFNARKPDEINVFRGVTKNYLFIGIIGITCVLQIIIIEFLGKFTSTVRLSWKLWLASVAIGVFSWPLAIIGKMIPVPKTHLSTYFMGPIQQLRSLFFLGDDHEAVCDRIISLW